MRIFKYRHVCLFEDLRHACKDRSGFPSIFRQALEVSVSEIRRLGGTADTHLREALNYLILLILHRRSEAERDAFIDIVKEKSRDETEVEIMAQTAAEVLIEQGVVGAKREAVVKLLAHRFGSVPQPLATHIAQLHHIAQLDALFDTVMEAESLEDIQM